MNGSKNPFRQLVATSVRDALLEKRAGNGRPALYYSAEKQVENLQAMFRKYSAQGGIWSAAAPMVSKIAQCLRILLTSITGPCEPVSTRQKGVLDSA